MAGYNPDPPTIIHSTTPINHFDAHSFLSSFLSQAALDASYRPDSILTERGPQPASAAGQGLTILQLDRIRQGIEGKRLGGEDLDSRFFGRNRSRSRSQSRDPAQGNRSQGQKRKRDEPSGTAFGKRTTFDDVAETERQPFVTANKDVAQQDWQDKEDFELAQDDEVDVTNEDRNPNAPEHGSDHEAAMDAESGSMTAMTKPPKTRDSGKDEDREIDKAERKRLKTARRRKEKKTAQG